MTSTPEFCPKCRFDSDQGHDEFCPTLLAARAVQAAADAAAESLRVAAKAEADEMARIEARFIRTDTNLASWTCKDCGALVGDRAVHARFDDDLSSRLSRLSAASDPRNWGGDGR